MSDATRPLNEKEVEQQCREFREMFEALRDEVGKVIVGHQEIVDNVLISLFSGGHVLLEGVPVEGHLLIDPAQLRLQPLQLQRLQFSPGHRLVLRVPDHLHAS